MAELPPVMEAAAGMLEMPRGEEEAGITEGLVLETEEAGRGVMPAGENEEFWLVEMAAMEMAAMEAMTEAEVGTETASPERLRGHPEGQNEQAQGHDADALQDAPPHVRSPPLPSEKPKPVSIQLLTSYLPPPLVSRGKFSTFSHGIAGPWSDRGTLRSASVR